MTDLWGELTRTDTTGTITIRRSYATTIDDLWDALTNPDRLERWMAPVSGDLCPGGAYLLTFDESDPEKQTSGTIECCEAPHRLAISWRNAGEAEESRVVATLTARAGQTELVLVHEGLSHQSDAGHAAGWQIHLTGLEALLAGHEPDGSVWSHWKELTDDYLATLA